MRRHTTSTRYIPEIDGLRFACVLMVVVFHVWVAWMVAAGETSFAPPFGSTPLSETPVQLDIGDRLLAGGAYGVEIFFAISAFVLALPFLSERLGNGKRVSVGRYYLRRLTRVEPPYLIALSLWAIVSFALPDEGSALLPRYIAGSAYLHQLSFGEFNPLLGVTWSLEIEVQFYLLVPVFASLLTRPTTALGRRLVVVLVGIGGFLVASWWEPFEGPALFLLFLPFFMAGWLLADVYVAHWRERAYRSVSWDIVGAVGWVGALALFGLAPEPTILAIGAVPVWMILAGAIRGRLSRRIMAFRFIATVGGAAYSIYLIHYPILVLWSQLFTVPAGLLATVMSLIALISCVGILSLLFFMFVERPCMDPRWPSRLLSAARPRATRFVGSLDANSAISQRT